MSNATPGQKFVRRMSQLQRRKAHLQERIADYQGSDASYDKSELAAIDWAMRVIELLPEVALEEIKKEA